MFTYMYLSGLVIGLIVYSITYLFVQDMSNWRRALVLLVIGFLFIFASLFIIGGFAGMPYGVLSLGIITIAILFHIFGKGQIGKKIIYTVVILSITLCVAFISLNKVDYWIVKKTHYTSGDEISM